MKNTVWMIGAFVFGIGLLPMASAQEPVSTAASSAPMAAKPAKGGDGSFFLGGVSTNGGGMEITSVRMELDYKETNAMVIAFDEDVHVTDPRYEVKADRMLVFLQGSNQIKRIIATGHVDIFQPDRHAICEKAVFEAGTGEIVLTGNPVLTNGANRVVGDKITVYQNDQRVVVEGSSRAHLAPEAAKKMDKKDAKKDENKP